jgi:hypothetical protein
MMKQNRANSLIMSTKPAKNGTDVVTLYTSPSPKGRETRPSYFAVKWALPPDQPKTGMKILSNFEFFSCCREQFIKYCLSLHRFKYV